MIETFTQNNNSILKYTKEMIKQLLFQECKNDLIYLMH